MHFRRAADPALIFLSDLQGCQLDWYRRISAKVGRPAPTVAENITSHTGRADPTHQWCGGMVDVNSHRKMLNGLKDILSKISGMEETPPTQVLMGIVGLLKSCRSRARKMLGVEQNASKLPLHSRSMPLRD